MGLPSDGVSPSRRTRTKLPTIIDSLEAGNRAIKSEADGLNARLHAFEAWYSQLECKVECLVEMQSPSSSDGLSHPLRVTRSGKSWRLESCWETPSGEYDDWRPVMDASMEEKITALESIPNLMGEMQSAQLGLLNRLKNANERFDQFASEMGIAGPGGEVDATPF